jgi:lipopolysaccharide export system ATP-binding protein
VSTARIGGRREPQLQQVATGVKSKPAAAKQSLLSARGLVKRYRRRTVVSDVSLNVGAGEIVGLLGPNGAGKTTSFYMMVGLVKPDGGSIELDGADITRLPMHARARLGIGYLPQEASVFRKLSVADNIMAILEIREDLNSEGRRAEQQRLLTELHIGHVRDGLGMSLSGGERRRTEIARALAANPRFILLDEPFAGVDPIAVLDIQHIVRHLAARGIGVLITDHNVRETLGICDRAYILNEGLVIADGSPAQVLENQTVRQVYLGEQFKM